MRMSSFGYKVTFPWNYSSTAGAVPLPSQGKAWLLRIARFVLQMPFAVSVWTGKLCSPLRVCARRLKRTVEDAGPYRVCANRLSRTVEDAGPYKVVGKTVPPPTLTVGQTRKMPF